MRLVYICAIIISIGLVVEGLVRQLVSQSVLNHLENCVDFLIVSGNL